MTKTLSLAVNGDRLNKTLEELAQIGRQADHTIKRLAFSPDDLAARTRLIEWMKAAGMTVRIDAGSNIIGRYAGQEDEARSLATGSHIDTVFFRRSLRRLARCNGRARSGTRDAGKQHSAVSPL